MHNNNIEYGCRSSGIYVLLFVCCFAVASNARAQTQSFEEVLKVVASDHAAEDQFGRSVSISGDYAIVGAFVEDEDADGDDTKTDAGSAYIFKRDGTGNWTEVQKLVASDRGPRDRFGHSVSISGNYAVVGAYVEDHDAGGINGFFNESGSAYVFERDGMDNWTEVQKLVASDRAANDWFGWSLSVSGNFAIVGARLEDHDTTGVGGLFDRAGSAYIFERDGAGVWAEAQKLVASDREEDDQFGFSVSISGDYAVVGAVSEDHNTVGNNMLTSAGSAYVFERDGMGNWIEVQKLVASDRDIFDQFGHSVSISGDYAIMGANRENISTAETDAGSAYIFERDGMGVWTEVQKLVASDREEDDEFGFSVSISGNYAVVGAFNEEHDADGNNIEADAGSAYMFERDDMGAWTEVKKLVASDREADDEFGYTVSISDEYVIVGARLEDPSSMGSAQVDAGSAYFFEKLCIPDTNTIVTQIACDSYTWAQNAETYTITGMYKDTLTNIEGCDSVVTLDLTINHSTASTDVQMACDSFEWIDGNTYTASNNTATYTTDNAAGCDSVVTLNLIIGHPSAGTDVQAVCDSLVWIDGNTYTTPNNTATHTLTNAAGCDSIVTLNLTIGYTAGTDVQTACDSLVWIDGVTYTASNSTATHTLTNAAGCDSVVTLDLTIYPSYDERMDVDLCEGDVYTLPNNTTADSAGSYPVSLTSVHGCDSIVTFNLFEQSNETRTITQTINEGEEYVFGGDTLTIEGTYTDTVAGAATNSCDSIIVLDLTVITGITNLFGGDAKMELFPNPVKNELRINLSGFEESQGELTITDISGKVLVKNTYTLCKDDCLYSIDLRTAASGVYLVRLSNESATMVKRISIVD